MLTEHKADRPPAEARQHTHPIFLQYTPHPHAGHSLRVTDCYHRQRESSLKPKGTHTGCTLSVCCIHSHTCYCRQRQPSSKQKTHLACLPHKPFHTRSQSTETGSHGLLTRQYNSVVQHTLYHARLQSLFGHAETLVESKRPQKYSPCSIISDFFWFRQKKCGKLIVPRFTSELMESDTVWISINH